MPPTYSPFWKPFEVLGRLGLARRKLSLGNLQLGPPGSADAMGGNDWVQYASAPKLYDLWGPPHASPWSGYHKPTLYAALDSIPGERTCPRGPPGLDAAGAPRETPAWLDGRTAVLLDLPGDESVAWAAHLCRREGMAPVATFNNWPHERGVVDATRVLAALLHYAPWVREGWDRIASPLDAPPVFIADAARLGRGPARPNDFDNRYFLLETDLPSGDALASRGIERLVYVRTGAPVLPPAAPPAHADADDLNGWLHEASKRVEVLLARAAPDAWSLTMPEPLDVTVRKTPYTTTRDPAFQGFRRNAAGGFGALVPEPGSGG